MHGRVWLEARKIRHQLLSTSPLVPRAAPNYALKRTVRDEVSR
jgi:hypothetical protein